MRTNKRVAQTKECLCCYTALRPTQRYAGHEDCIREWVCPKCKFRWWWDSESNRRKELSMSARSNPHDSTFGTRDERLCKVIPPGELTLNKTTPILAYDKRGQVTHRYHRGMKKWFEMTRRK